MTCWFQRCLQRQLQSNHGGNYDITNRRHKVGEMISKRPKESFYFLGLWPEVHGLLSFPFESLENPLPQLLTSKSDRREKMSGFLLRKSILQVQRWNTSFLSVLSDGLGGRMGGISGGRSLVAIFPIVYLIFLLLTLEMTPRTSFVKHCHPHAHVLWLIWHHLSFPGVVGTWSRLSQWSQWLVQEGACDPSRDNEEPGVLGALFLLGC